MQSLAKTLSFSVKNQKLSQLLSVSLIAIYKSLNAGANNPGHLFGQVCRRSPQFRGFQQQDAHELLRHLMDSLRTEEVKRQKTAILKQFGLSEKTDPKTVSAKIKRKLQVRVFINDSL